MRKMFATNIEEEIQRNFKITCIQNDVKMNDVLEYLMKQYSEGKLLVDLSKDKK